jgi:putative salt-induced outer membrane protein YdiY
MFMLNQMARRGFKPATLAVLGMSLVLGLTATAQAQTNLPAPPPPPPPKWDSTAGFGLSITRGNSDTTLATINAQTQHKTPSNEFIFGGDAAYGKDSGVENVETWHAFGQYNHLVTDRLYYGLKLDYLHDGIADIRYRFTVAPLLGYYLIKETNTTLTVEAGPGYVFQDLGGDKRDYATLRLGERFEHKFSATAKMWQSLEILPEISDFNNYYANAEIGAESALTKHASLRAYIQDTYYNIPAPGRLKNDLKLVAGLQYKF